MFWKYYLAYISVHLICFTTSQKFSRTLTDILTYYETLNKADVTHRVVRREIPENHVRHIRFQSHGKTFDVDLVPSHEIFSPLFEAISIDKDGQEHSVFIDKNSHYKGHLKSNEHSSAVAHVDNGMITATIATDDDTFVIEPMWRHVDSDPTHDMIVYKVSDVRWNLTHANSSIKMGARTCGVDDSHPLLIKPSDAFVTHKHRARRNIVMSRNICNLTLVGDHTFFLQIGRSDIPLAINYMLQVISRVNVIYKATDWTGIGANIGFQVKKTIIHEAYSTDGKHGYNQKVNGVWNVDKLLSEFSRENWKNTCLAHLFTYQDFARGVIGLAYVSSPSYFEVGGICTKLYEDAVSKRYLNCGLSSGTNWGRRLLSTEADLVTAHELGHNFGSNHDPEKCSSSSNGKYIMYATSVSGDQPNNDQFSVCSRDQIGSVLKAKKNLCFVDAVEKYCGNMVVEEDEDCDPGVKGDKCCTANCRLRGNFKCSDVNHVCCRNCQFAPTEKVCRGEFRQECKAATACTGNSKDCPVAPKLNASEECGFSKGNCINGNCTSLCTQVNQISCLCGAGGDSCKICCKATNGGNCEPLIKGGLKSPENDGMPCFLSEGQGQCVSGDCKKPQQNVEDEFKDLLNDFSFSKFARFMEANIVGTILVFSLMIWIPAGCVVNYLDKKQDEENEEMKHWLNPFNRQLLKTTPAKFKALFQKGRREPPALRTQYHISS